MDARHHAETASRKLTSNSAYHLFQRQFSPNGKWIVFEAVRNPPNPNVESALSVMPTAGGPWTRLSEGVHWDGNTIYFVSGRGGFFNVWGIRFDSTNGKSMGKAFRVTAF